MSMMFQAARAVTVALWLSQTPVHTAGYQCPPFLLEAAVHIERPTPCRQENCSTVTERQLEIAVTVIGKDTHKDVPNVLSKLTYTEPLG